MSSLRCPLCLAANPADATACAACGVGLVAQCPSCDAVNDRRASACRVCGWQPLVIDAALPARAVRPAASAAPTALTAPTAPAPTAAVPPPQPAALPTLALIEPRAILTAQEEAALRAGLDDLPAPQWPELSSPGRPATDPVAAGLELWGDPYAAQPPAPPRPQAPHEPTLTAKAMARQAARRARMTQGSADGQTPLPRDVLVLEEDATARRQLCELLGGFGFEVHAAETLDQADRLLRTRPFAAAFLDLVLEGAEEGAGLELCYRIKQADASGSTAVVVLAAQERPADRVRAALARSDVYLPRPISRGDVARALESCGVRLPADARRR
jgi:CheY-like chemotaxis protein